MFLGRGGWKTSSKTHFPQIIETEAIAFDELLDLFLFTNSCKSIGSSLLKNVSRKYFSPQEKKKPQIQIFI